MTLVDTAGDSDSIGLSSKSRYGPTDHKQKMCVFCRLLAAGSASRAEASRAATDAGIGEHG